MLSLYQVLDIKIEADYHQINTWKKLLFLTQIRWCMSTTFINNIHCGQSSGGGASKTIIITSRCKAYTVDLDFSAETKL